MSDKKKAAQTAAEAWLKLTDAGKYAQAWDQCSAYFKGIVSKDKLAQQLKAVREPMGKLLSRTLSNSTYTTSAPGAPDGQYVILSFNTSFTNKRTAIETVTANLDPDGKWRISGYYIK